MTPITPYEAIESNEANLPLVCTTTEYTTGIHEKVYSKISWCTFWFDCIALLRGTADDARWKPLDESRNAKDVLSDDSVITYLLQAGREALHGLLAQQSEREDNA